MSAESERLDACGCCEGVEPPTPIGNAAGLSSLAYRVDTHPGFAARMLQSLPLARGGSGDADAPRPLARLLTRAGDDPAVAFVDAAACVADVLAFYQERIANEGFLRTATERRSVLELARAIGYELKPGLAASVHLVFTVEDAPGAPGVCTLAAGTPVQSVPPQDKLPQVFETSEELVARAEWNALAPRQTRPADLAVLDVAAAGVDGATRKALVLLGPAGSFPVGTEGLHSGLQSLDLFRLDPSLEVEAQVDALEIDHVWFSETADGIVGGDLLLFVGKKGEDQVDLLVRRAIAVLAEPASKRIRVDLEALPPPNADPPPYRARSLSVPYRSTTFTDFASATVSPVPFVGTSLTATVAGQAWHESELQAMIGIQGWVPEQMIRTIAVSTSATVPRGPLLTAAAGAFGFGARLGFFGHNAPKWAILPDSDTTKGNAYPNGWDDGDAGVPSGSSRTIWEDSQGVPITPRVRLERLVPNVVRASWVVFDAPNVPGLFARAYTVLDARETSLADFGLSGRAMQLRLAGADGESLPDSAAEDAPFPFRSTTAHVASRRLELAELPIDAPIEAGTTRVELDRMVLGLAPGRLLAFVGERADLPGVRAAEIATLADVVHAGGRSTLMLAAPGLVHAWLRGSLRISANVAHATHGETVGEVLGNGDASVANQRFVLKRPPTTWLPATGGARSTLEVRVAGVLWDEVPSLYGVAADAPVYTTRIDDDAHMTLIFGDGVQGARLPSNTLNVAARYRSGLGPDGEVGAGTLTMLRAMPLGLRGVDNPLAASGAAGPERLDDARRNAPLTLLTFDRVVSLLDYENYARAFPGIGKARGDLLWIDGDARVFVTVAGATGSAPGADVLDALIASIAAASDPSQAFDAGAYVPRYFALTVGVAVDARYVAADVLAAVSEVLLNSYGFAMRELAQSVTVAEVVASIHTVAGVLAVDVDELRPYGDEALLAGLSPAAVPAFGARWDAESRRVQPAELLLINPAGLVVREMSR